MDLVSTVRKSGSRGGVNFSWDDVAASTHRENYLGHSLKAPVGRWQKGRDLTWYANSDPAAADSGETEAERQARERRDEIKRIKEAEDDAISRALGLPVASRNATGANSIQVDGSKIPNAAPELVTGGREDGGDSRERPRRPERWTGEEQDSRDRERHPRSRQKHRDRSRSRSRSHDRDKRRDRSPRRRRSSRERRQRGDGARRRSPSPDPERRGRKHRYRSRSRSPDRSERKKRSRSRDRHRHRSPLKPRRSSPESRGQRREPRSP